MFTVTQTILPRYFLAKQQQPNKKTNPGSSGLIRPIIPVCLSAHLCWQFLTGLRGEPNQRTDSNLKPLLSLLSLFSNRSICSVMQLTVYVHEQLHQQKINPHCCQRNHFLNFIFKGTRTDQKDETNVAGSLQAQADTIASAAFCLAKSVLPQPLVQDNDFTSENTTDKGLSSVLEGSEMLFSQQDNMYLRLLENLSTIKKYFWEKAISSNHSCEQIFNFLDRSCPHQIKSEGKEHWLLQYSQSRSGSAHRKTSQIRNHRRLQSQCSCSTSYRCTQGTRPHQMLPQGRTRVSIMYGTSALLFAA